MNRIIIYGTEYGTAKLYADELSRRTGIEAISYKDVTNIDSYETIIYIGALYAGGVLGMSKTFKAINNPSDKRFIIITVGLADPADEENIKNIRGGITKQISREILAKSRIYHVRGGIDYSKLGFKHRTMMSLLYKKAKGLPDERKTAEVKAMVDTYNKTIDFVDFSYLDIVTGEMDYGRE